MVTRRRGRFVVLIGLAAYAIVVAVIVLTPVSYASIVHSIADALREVPGLRWFGSGWIEFVANILLFAPLGFLLTLLLRRPWQGVVLALVISAGVELVQVLVPSRQPSVRDVVANTVGAGLGALVAWWVVRRRWRRELVTSAPPSATRRAR